MRDTHFPSTSTKYIYHRRSKNFTLEYEKLGWLHGLGYGEGGKS